MPGPTTRIPLGTFDSYSLFIGVAIVLSMALGAALAWRRHGVPPGKLADAGLLALTGGLALARALHILIHWDYFQKHQAEITQFSAGGLDARGAILGALLGLMLAARWRRVPWRVLTDAAALALPLIALGAWLGCAAAHCAYGAEVGNLSNYPDWLVWEERDLSNTILPRYAVQRLGLAISALTLLLIALLAWRGWLHGRRAGLALMAAASGWFGLGFLRGDPVPNLAGLRVDQWLDLALVSLGLLLAAWPGAPGSRTQPDA